MFCIRQHSMNIDSFRCSCAICTKCKNLLKTNMRLLRKAQHVALWEQDVFLHSKRSAALPAAGSPVRSYIFFRPIYIYIWMQQSLLLRTVFPRQIQRRSSRKSRILVPLGRSPQPEAAFHKRQYLFLMLSKLCGYMVLFQLPQKMFNLFVPSQERDASTSFACV